MTIQEYLSSLRGKTAAVLGIGVSNTPLIELLCRNGVQVIACDKKSREALGERAPQLEALGAQMAVQPIDNPLCGLGFSTTIRNSLVVNVKTATTSQYMKILF